ncbi:MAG TPA: SURF1 family protein [Anaerolineales bacterium]|nr:SURF1 family protein [Anaerolineales bacterium]
MRGQGVRSSRSYAVRRWGFFALAMILGVVCVRLGFWQLDRLGQRREQNAAIEARLAEPSIRLPDDLAEVDDLAYRRARVRGTFDASGEIYLTNRSLDEIAGVHIVTPLVLEGREDVLLVDRGWISDPDYRTRSAESWSAEGIVEIAGVLMPSQREPGLSFFADPIPAPGEPPLSEWRALYIPGIRQQLSAPVLDAFLMQESDSGDPELPIPAPELDLSEGPHLSYALQWFAFAGTAIVGGAYWIRRTRV